MTTRQDDSRWWGGWGRSEGRLSLLDLIRNNTLDAPAAALLWLLVERKASVIVAAGPRLAGKTTLLTALLDFAPPWYAKVYTRGQHEDFSFLSRAEPAKTYILVPELSEHTPAYLWGEPVLALFRALEQGFSLGATMHADSPQEAIAMLSGDPVYVPRDLVSNLHAIVNLRLLYGQREMVRRASLVTLVTPGPAFVPLARWDPDRDSFSHEDSPEAREALAARVGMAPGEVAPDLAGRHAKLESWLAGSPLMADEVQELVRRHYEDS